MPVGTLDVAFYRDDIGLRPVLPEAATDIAVDLTRIDHRAGGRRASPDGPSGPPSTPWGSTGGPRWSSCTRMGATGATTIRPDYVGKNLPTNRDEMVDVSDEGVSLGELVSR